MIEITPIKELNAEITVPGSKYIANRILILASLTNGTSIISNVPNNDDINNAITALRLFGVKIIKKGTALEIKGACGKLIAPTKKINVGDSGTLLRYATGIACLAKGTTKITGSDTIKKRPIKDLLDALKQVNIDCESNNYSYPPITIRGGTLNGGTINIKGNISSQYISSLLIIAPFAKKKLEINITTELVSKPYVDLTMDLMEEFGVSIERHNYHRFIINPKKRYLHLNYHIPGDWSSASYFLAAAALVPGRVKLTDMDMHSIQGESKFYNALYQMGVDIEKGKDWVIVEGPDQLNGIEIDMNSMPDVVQTLAAVAMFANSKTRIFNIHNLIYKESDRINMTATELKKLGTKIETLGGELIINPGKIKSASPVIFETHNDHRMAMSLALIGLKIKGIKIKNPEVVNKSFPGYWDKLRDIGVKIRDV